MRIAISGCARHIDSERLAVELEHARRLHRDRAGRNPRAEHHAELAEEVARAEPRHPALPAGALAGELDFAGLDHEEVVGGLAGAHHELSGRELALVVAAHPDGGVFTRVQERPPARGGFVGSREGL